MNSLECVLSYKLISKSNLKRLLRATSDNPSDGGELGKSLNV